MTPFSVSCVLTLRRCGLSHDVGCLDSLTPGPASRADGAGPKGSVELDVAVAVDRAELDRLDATTNGTTGASENASAGVGAGASEKASVGVAGGSSEKAIIGGGGASAGGGTDGGVVGAIGADAGADEAIVDGSYNVVVTTDVTMNGRLPPIRHTRSRTTHRATLSAGRGPSRTRRWWRESGDGTNRRPWLEASVWLESKLSRATHDRPRRIAEPHPARRRARQIQHRPRHFDLDRQPASSRPARRPSSR